MNDFPQSYYYVTAIGLYAMAFELFAMHCAKACGLGFSATAVTFQLLLFIASAVVFPIATSYRTK